MDFTITNTGGCDRIFGWQLVATYTSTVDVIQIFSDRESDQTGVIPAGGTETVRVYISGAVSSPTRDQPGFEEEAYLEVNLYSPDIYTPPVLDSDSATFFFHDCNIPIPNPTTTATVTPQPTVSPTITPTATPTATPPVSCPQQSVDSWRDQQCGPVRFGATVQYSYKLNSEYLQNWYFKERVIPVRVAGRNCSNGDVTQNTNPTLALLSRISDIIYIQGAPWFLVPCETMRNQTIFWGPTPEIVADETNACQYFNTQLIDVSGTCHGGGTVTTSVTGTSTSCTFAGQTDDVCGGFP